MIGISIDGNIFAIDIFLISSMFKPIAKINTPPMAEISRIKLSLNKGAMSPENSVMDP